MTNSYTANLRRIMRDATDFSLLCEIYSSDAAPPFNPNDAVKRYAASADLQATVGSFFGANYTRLVRSFGTTKRTITPEVNSASIDFDNLSREISAFELAGDGFEGLVMVIRLISRSQSLLLSDSLILFVGRCEKPRSGTRDKMSVSAKHILGGSDAEIPRRKFTPDDAEGRHPSDILFEGFRFTPQYGVAYYSTRERRGGFLGFLGFKKTVTHTVSYSSYSDLDASKYLPEAFGRVQLIGTHLAYLDLGTLIRMTTAFCEGEIADFSNFRVVTAPFFASFIPYYLYGKLGGVGGQLPYNVANYPGNGHYSRTALVFSAAGGTTVQNNDAAPDLVSVLLAKIVTVPNAAGAWTAAEWSDDGAAQTRFCLTSPDYYKLAPSWIDDASFLEVFNYNKEFIFDASYSDTIFVPDNANYNVANAPGMANFFASTAVASPEYFKYLGKQKTATETFLLDPKISLYTSIIPIEVDPGGGGGGGGEEPPTANLFFFLRRRYVSNVVITERIKLIDFFHQILFPASRMFFSQGADGRIKINSKKPVDFALSTAALSGGTVALDDVSKWIADLSGHLLIDPATVNSEVRTVTGAAYSAAQNSVALSASANITVAAFAGGNGANTPAAARLTVASVIANCFVNLDGINIPFVAALGDTVQSIAGFVYGVINGHPTLRRKFAATWTPNTAIVDVTAKFGSLTLNTALTEPHVAPLANPTAAPVLTATAAGTFAAGTYRVAYSFANARGQTLLSPYAQAVLTANQKISVAAVTLPAGAAEIIWYCSPAAGSRQLRLVKRNTGAAFIIDALPKVSAPLPPDFNRTGAEVLRVAEVFSDRAEVRSDILRSNVLKGSFEWLPERKNPVNQVEVTFRDSTQDFRLSRLVLRDDEHIAKTKKTSKLEINGQAIDGTNQAYRIASGLLAENRDADFFYKWTADREALLLEEGEVVCITDGGSGVYNLPVRIEEISTGGDKGFPTVTFSARKYSTTLYDDSTAERQIPVIVETGSSAAIAADDALYTYVPTNFTANRSLNLTTATVGDLANAIATVMDDLENGRK